MEALRTRRNYETMTPHRKQLRKDLEQAVEIIDQLTFELKGSGSSVVYSVWAFCMLKVTKVLIIGVAFIT